jgi:hypothetical protein
MESCQVEDEYIEDQDEFDPYDDEDIDQDEMQDEMTNELVSS